MTKRYNSYRRHKKNDFLSLNEDCAEQLEAFTVQDIRSVPMLPGMAWVRGTGGVRLLLSDGDIARFNLKPGQLPGTDILRDLLPKSRSAIAYKVALDILCRGDCSHRELTDKMRAKGICEQDACAAADRAQAAGYIDDAEHARRFARSRSARGALGPRQIRCRLLGKGIDRETVEEILEELPPARLALQNLVADQYARRNLQDKKEYTRTVNALLRKGYDWEDIQGVLGEYAGREEYYD